MPSPAAAATALHVAVRVTDGVAVCTLRGTVAPTDVPRLVDGIHAAFLASSEGVVMLDLTHVDQLPPAAVPGVLAAARHARRQGHRLLVCGLRDDAVQPSAMRRLHALLTVLPDATSGLRAVAIEAGASTRPA